MTEWSERAAPIAEDRGDRINQSWPAPAPSLRWLIEKLHESLAADRARPMMVIFSHQHYHLFRTFYPWLFGGDGLFNGPHGAMQVVVSDIAMPWALIPVQSLKPFAECPVNEPERRRLHLQTRRFAWWAKARERLGAHQPETAHQRRMARRRRRGW